MGSEIRAEVISIGDELTSGQRLDTNSQWIATQLGELGVRTMFHTTVADDLESNIDVFRIAARRADFVICTGGLGPTADDLTRQAIASAFDLPLELNLDTLKHIESLFARRHRAMPEQNRVQAYFPGGSRIVLNPHGSAPGIDLSVTSPTGRRCRIFALPGVPAEMTEMWAETVLPRLREEHGLGKQRIYYQSIKLFGLGESDVEAKIPDLIARDRDPRVGITVSHATITLRLASTAADELEAAKNMESTIQLIRATFGDFVFGQGEQELPDVIFDQLARRSESLAVVEIGERGIIGDWIRELQSKSPNAAIKVIKCFDRFSDLYADLHVESPDGNASPSVESLRNLAKLIRQSQKADWALVAGPYPPSAALRLLDDRQEDSFFIAVDGPGDRNNARRLRPSGHPDVVLHRIAKQALDDLRRQMILKI
jgi:nicotinamide-nucleotide amidase